MYLFNASVYLSSFLPSIRYDILNWTVFVSFFNMTKLIFIRYCDILLKLNNGIRTVLIGWPAVILPNWRYQLAFSMHFPLSHYEVHQVILLCYSNNALTYFFKRCMSEKI